jgi:hypothetical protein
VKYAFWVHLPSDNDLAPPIKKVIEARNSFVAALMLDDEYVRVSEADLVPEKEWKEVIRASGEALCASCFKALRTHQQPIRATAPAVVVDCAGTWLKT